jgi:spoIIIJ-associated protein
MPESFVTDQDEEHLEEQSIEQLKESAVYDNSNIEASFFDEQCEASEVAQEIGEKINRLFSHICFDIDAIRVCAYDEETILVEFSGKDAALLIGKEGYRYKALSYMIFNWISTEYNLQLRLEIAEFLKNQEESISRYLVSVCENVDRDGRSQTKVLDGVLVQIALKQLRETYPDKYVAIRSTRDGLKFIIINDYNNY